MDAIFDQVEPLKEWLKLKSWREKESFPVTKALKHEVLKFYFFGYFHQFTMSLIQDSYASIPYVMQWDDHDIMDGWGSYRDSLHHSPVFQCMFRAALKYRLLFQHHTTVDRAKSDGLFGITSFSDFKFLGPETAVLAVDTRAERTMQQVLSEGSWDIIWRTVYERLEQAKSVKHLLVILGVPMIFPDLNFAERAFEFFSRKNARKGTRHQIAKPFMNDFDEPELMDDLIDHWDCRYHAMEKIEVLNELEKLSEKFGVRSTILSGDVHCCGIALFRSIDVSELSPANRHEDYAGYLRRLRKTKSDKEVLDKQPKSSGIKRLLTLNQTKSLTPSTITPTLRRDPRFIPNVITSAIGNVSPPRTLILAYHYLHKPARLTATTMEDFLDLFKTSTNGHKVKHQKIHGRRNFAVIQYAEKAPQSILRSIESLGSGPNNAKDRTASPKSTKYTVTSVRKVGVANEPESNKKVNTHDQLYEDDLVITLFLEPKKDGQDAVGYSTIVPALEI
ncbi:hypothetical protein BKA69DRAFT_1089388 [Paraphysoderma sedebokerense]|nr:hypothetical protein BKA69DRAFT_1089388 [Paraphysoderma sedebokerense]